MVDGRTPPRHGQGVSRYMSSRTEWEILKDEAKRILADRAKVRGMMTYSELSDRIMSKRLSPRGPQLFRLLDEISTDEYQAGRGLLSCIVVHKVGDMEPGVGFYDLAKRMGYRSGDKLALWVKELHRVHAAWAV